MRDQAKDQHDAGNTEQPGRVAQQFLVIVAREKNAGDPAKAEPHELFAEIAVNAGHVLLRREDGARAGEHHQAQGDEPEHDDEQQVSDVALHEHDRVLLGIHQVINGEPADDRDVQHQDGKHQSRAPDAERHQDAQGNIE